MMKFKLLLLGCMLSTLLVNAGEKPKYTTYMQFGGMYYSSEHVTSAGIGPGIGLCVDINRNILIQSDVNLFWLNGNTGSFRLSFGYKKTGVWSPAVFTGFTTIFGDRTEILLDDGARPINPVFAISLRLAPLRWENENGYVSAIEFDYGFGNYKAKYLEIKLISVGLKLYQ